ncbi:hypothetical protein LCGC14_1871390 [marine sediment metagenome]|uniref:Uncharacterized protein n=1 Tax=marine sediment metagenome TaxID=412755 RepID=A0A0F9G4W5_9ZZZZ
MTPRVALALDTIIWACATGALFAFEFTKTAIVVGLIGTFYLSRCVVVMVHIMKAEQLLAQNLRNNPYE